MTNNSTIKIAKIINETSFVLNAGANLDINKGDVFKILGEPGQEVIDPDTHEVLGYMDTIKGTITITQVYEKMSIAQTKKETHLDSLNFGPLFTREELFVDNSQITGGLNEYSEEPIQIGDKVKLQYKAKSND